MSRILVALLAVALGACSGVYELPDPPPEDERASVQIDPAAEERESAARYIDARRTLVALYEALGAESWDDAIALVSTETRLLLSDGGGGDAAETLAVGRLTVGGRTYGFEPIDLLLLRDPDGMEDSVVGESENETPRRKELFLVSAEETRRVVLILEADQWVVHFRRLPVDRLDRIE